VPVTGLRVEHFAEGSTPLGVGVASPRLSWRTETDVPSWLQTGAEIEVEGGPSWAVTGRDSVLVPWGAAPLASRDRVRWRVRVAGPDGSTSEWSDWAAFEVGLLAPADWSAVVVAPDWDEPSTAGQPCPHLRTRFSLDADVVRARLHVTALGVYEATVNGAVVGDHVLAPGWTAYASRLHVQSFDVTSLLQSGENELAAVVADGWYRGNLGFAGNRDVYGNRTGLLAQLEVELADGSTKVIATDDAWEAAPGPERTADLYDGETYDARVEVGPWAPVRVVALDPGVLVPQPSPPVRVTEVVRPVAITTSAAGTTIVDFGQNLVGVVRLRVSGPAGTTITLRHAEVLEDGGELCTRILRAAQATDRYTLAGPGAGAVEEWHPRFTFHGFRYASVEGWPGPEPLSLDDLDALVVHTDAVRTGWFECSDERVNRLHENGVWSWRGNSVSLPTDCPQRDERLGWTGDLQVFAPTASFLFDVAGFLDGWLADLAADQRPDGRVPAVVPDVLRNMNAFAAGWGDAATVVPTVVHEWFGDVGVLERQLDSMAGWVDSIERRAGPSRLWAGEFQFGDWVDPTVDPRTPGSARTDPSFVATAYFARSADLVAAAARVVGDDERAGRYEALAAEVRDALRHEWVAPSGRVVADTQAGCALALCFDLVEERDRPVVGARVRELVRSERYRLSTGFLGTPVLCPALTSVGHVDAAYRLLLQTEAPSWLYPVTKGATTIWERWDALRPDGSLNPGEDMLSFNHYALGAVGAWLHSTVGGLSATAPGFRSFRVAPLPGVGVSSASVVFDSRYGRIGARWSLEGRGVELSVDVPPNTSAEVVLPGFAGDGAVRRVGSGSHRWRYAIDAETYMAWTGARPYSLRSPLRELRKDASAWAVVERHAPVIARTAPDDDGRSLQTLLSRSSVDPSVHVALTEELGRISPPLPDPPEPVGV
jgi:alpha-L-rhamnosidase